MMIWDRGLEEVGFMETGVYNLLAGKESLV
jgi:hypothetical protein